MAFASRLVIAAALLGGCSAPTAAPGMLARGPNAHVEDARYVELARVAPRTEGTRVLLVVFPRSACSGSASTVLVDPNGTFVGALLPGTASLLEVPVATRSVVAISSVELDAPTGMSSVADEIALPPAPGGLVLESWRWSARTCGRSGHYADVRAATKDELEQTLGENELRWLVPEKDLGAAWLGARHARLAEVLASEWTRQGKLPAKTRHAKR